MFQSEFVSEIFLQSPISNFQKDKKYLKQNRVMRFETHVQEIEVYLLSSIFL